MTPMSAANKMGNALVMHCVQNCGDLLLSLSAGMASHLSFHNALVRAVVGCPQGCRTSPHVHLAYLHDGLWHC